MKATFSEYPKWVTRNHLLVSSLIAKTHRESLPMLNPSNVPLNSADAHKHCKKSMIGWKLLARKLWPSKFCNSNQQSTLQMLLLNNMFNVSKRQEPVIDMLADLLDEAKAIAAAVSDNAMEEELPIPKDLLRSFNNDLERIKAHLLTAADVPEKIHTSS